MCGIRLAQNQYEEPFPFFFLLCTLNGRATFCLLHYRMKRGPQLTSINILQCCTNHFITASYVLPSLGILILLYSNGTPIVGCEHLLPPLV